RPRRRRPRQSRRGCGQTIATITAGSHPAIQTGARLSSLTAWAIVKPRTTSAPASAMTVTGERKLLIAPAPRAVKQTCHQGRPAPAPMSSGLYSPPGLADRAATNGCVKAGRCATIGCTSTRGAFMSTTQIDRDYARRLCCAASRERVFEALATTSGLAGWWTPEVSGWPGPGGRLELRFAGADTIRLSVEAAAPGSRVVWRVQENTGRPEWRGTRITFVLASDGPGRTLIAFRP